MKLQELINKLNEFEKSKEVKLKINNKEYNISHVCSYRGYYEDLTIDYTKDETKLITIEDFIIELKSALGKSFTGYKGGDFIMHQNTLIWVSEYDYNSGKGINNFIEDENKIIITIKKQEKIFTPEDKDNMIKDIFGEIAIQKLKRKRI